MEHLANAFSVLKVDVDDVDEIRGASSTSKPSTEDTGDSSVWVDLEQIQDTFGVLPEAEVIIDSDIIPDTEFGLGVAEIILNKKGKRNKEVNHSDNIVLANESQCEEYKLPLVWIDLEMTGLNVEVDRILEIACIVTDGRLTKSIEGPDLVIHQSKECLDRMGEWCQSHHKDSGLIIKVLQSTISEREAEKQIIEFVKRNIGTYTPLLAGNSVYVDFVFLKGRVTDTEEILQKFDEFEWEGVAEVVTTLLEMTEKYMPDLASLFSHVVVDVSSVKALCIRWYPREKKKAPPKENKHRALDDIRESIMELKYYKENIFKASRK